MVIEYGFKAAHGCPSFPYAIPAISLPSLSRRPPITAAGLQLGINALVSKAPTHVEPQTSASLRFELASNMAWHGMSLLYSHASHQSALPLEVLSTTASVAAVLAAGAAGLAAGAISLASAAGVATLAAFSVASQG